MGWSIPYGMSSVFEVVLCGRWLVVGSKVVCWLVGVAGVRRVCGVHSWQNGTRCRDGVKVLWCCSYLVWLVFEGSIPTCACFQLKPFLLPVRYVFVVVVVVVWLVLFQRKCSPS